MTNEEVASRGERMANDLLTGCMIGVQNDHDVIERFQILAIASVNILGTLAFNLEFNNGTNGSKYIEDCAKDAKACLFELKEQAAAGETRVIGLRRK